MVVREAERPIFRVVPPGAESEHDPPAGDLVDGDRHLREQARVAEGDAGDQLSELDPARRCREGGEQRPRLVDVLGRLVVPSGPEVIAYPDGVEPDLLRVT